MSSSTDAEGWSTAARVTLCALVVAAGASLVWLVHPWFDAVNDAALYVLTAKALAAGEGYAYLGAPFTIRPPGFSALLAPLVAWRGVDFLALNLFVSAWGVLAVALLFAWARPRLGTLLAACVAACVWLNPCWRQLCNQTMSDVPGAALLLACLLLERRARRAPSRRNDVLLALCIGLSALVRSGLVLLVPAILLQRVLERRRAKEGTTPWPRFARERLLAVAVLPLLVLLPWEVRRAAVQPVAPSDQTPLHSYSAGMWHADWGDPGSPRIPLAQVLGRVPVRGAETLAALGGRLGEGGGSSVQRILGAAALALALLVLLRENRAEGWFLAGTLIVILVYFDFRTRLVLPVHLLVLPAFVEGAVRALRRVVDERPARLVLAALVVLLAVLDFDPRPGWRAIEREHRAYLGSSRELSARLPAASCVAAPQGWHYGVYLDRPVYTLVLGWARGNVRGVEEVIDRYRIERVLLSSRTDANLTLGKYLLERYGVEERVGELAIVRVR